MRREGFELSVSPPRVVYREEGGHKLEPLEEVICEVEEDQAGSVIEVAARPGTVTCLKASMHSCFYWGHSTGAGASGGACQRGLWRGVLETQTLTPWAGCRVHVLAC